MQKLVNALKDFRKLKSFVLAKLNKGKKPLSQDKNLHKRRVQSSFLCRYLYSHLPLLKMSKKRANT